MDINIIITVNKMKNRHTKQYDIFIKSFYKAANNVFHTMSVFGLTGIPKLSNTIDIEHDKQFLFLSQNSKFTSLNGIDRLEYEAFAYALYRIYKNQSIHNIAVITNVQSWVKKYKECYKKIKTYLYSEFVLNHLSISEFMIHVDDVTMGIKYEDITTDIQLQYNIMFELDRKLLLANL